MISLKWMQTLWLVFFCFVIGVTSAHAATPFEKSMREGLDLLSNKQYQKAQEKFKAASKANPQSSLPWVAAGTTLNNIGQFNKAYAALILAESKGANLPSLDLQIARAALGIGRYSIAIERLQMFERKQPGKGKTSEFLGRAYLAQGDLDKAENYFKEAIRRDSSLKASSLLALATLEKKRGNHEKAKQHLVKQFEEVPDAPLTIYLGNKLREKVAPSRKTKADKPWSAGVSVAYNYNNNVLRLSDSLLALPTNVTETQSNNFIYAVDGKYKWALAPDKKISAGYALQGALHGDIPSSDYSNHVFFANYSQILKPRLLATVQTTYSKTILNGDGFSEAYNLRPSAIYKLTPRISVEGNYTYSASEFDPVPTSGFQERGGNAHALGATGYFDLSDKSVYKPRLQLGVSNIWNNSRGSDFEFSALAITAGAGFQLPHKFSLSTVLTFTGIDYANNNSLATNLQTGVSAALFQFNREDDQVTFQARLARPLIAKELPFMAGVLDNIRMESFAVFNVIDNDSNITAYKYNQKSVTLGLSARF